MNYRHLLLATALFCGPAFANDTTAELKTGGLIYTTTGNVEMAKEDLFISMEKVEVNYVFRNNTDHDIKSYIAFPMPDITGDPETPFSYDDVDTDNFVDFKVTQDGEAVETQLQQRAYVSGIDVTDLLSKYKIPLSPISHRTGEALGQVSIEGQNELIAKGLLAGANDPRDPSEFGAVWTLHQVYYWETTFPAGKEVKVHHQYRPSLGKDAAIVDYLDKDGNEKGSMYQDYLSNYCVGDLQKKILQNRDERRDNPRYFFLERRISYILTTGSNWSNSRITDFHLTIDKGQKDNIVSFCGNGIEKTGPTTFELRANNFYPQKDLNILFWVHTENSQH